MSNFLLSPDAPRPDPNAFGPSMLSQKDRSQKPKLRPPEAPIKSPLIYSPLARYQSPSAAAPPTLITEFEILDRIDSRQGAFSEVFKVRSRKDNQLYAIKKLTRPYRSCRDRETKLQEVKIMCDLERHENLVHQFSFWEEHHQLYIKTELCECSLQAYLQKHPEVPEVLIWNWAYDITRALKHLHDHKLMHLDVKPSNIMMKDGILKLGDFGLITPVDQWEEEREGDSAFMAPELLQMDDTEVGTQVDIFSFGATLFEIASNIEMPTEDVPWRKLRTEGLVELMHDMDAAQALTLFRKRSLELRELIISMMHPNPKNRPTANQLLSHPRIAHVHHQRLAARATSSSSSSSQDLSDSADVSGNNMHKLFSGMGMIATTVMSLFPRFGGKHSEENHSMPVSASAPCVHLGTTAADTSLFGGSPPAAQQRRQEPRAPHTVGGDFRLHGRPRLPHSRSNGSVSMNPDLTPSNGPLGRASGNSGAGPIDMDSTSDDLEQDDEINDELDSDLIPFGAAAAHAPLVFEPQRLFSPAPTTQVRAVPQGLFSPPRATPPPTPTSTRRHAPLRFAPSSESQATLELSGAPTLLVTRNSSNQQLQSSLAVTPHKRPPSRTPGSTRRLRLSQEENVENRDDVENTPMPDSLDLTSGSKARRTIAPKNLMTEFDTLESMNSKPFSTGPHNRRKTRF